MPYYDADKVLVLQIRDRMRDLLEADAHVRLAYLAPKPIYRLPSENVSKNEGLRVSLLLAQSAQEVSASQTHTKLPTLALSVQTFCSTARTGSNEEEDALDLCATVTESIKDVLFRYQSDPSDLLPNQIERLWDTMTFPAPTRYEQAQNGMYFSLTYLVLSSYQRNV